MSDLSISAVANTSISSRPSSPSDSNSTSKPQPPGGDPSLWQTLYTVTAHVTNTGSVPGAAVPQIYLGLPSPTNKDDVTPKKVLRGFEKVMLQPGESREVQFPLMRRDLSFWDVGRQMWIIADGEVGVYAGFSSRDVRVEEGFRPLGGGGGSYGNAGKDR